MTTRQEIKDYTTGLSEGFINSREMVQTIGYKFVTLYNIETGKSKKIAINDFLSVNQKGIEVDQDDWSIISEN